nr:hypothetical protein [Lachnospiraceae bacterium]
IEEGQTATAHIKNKDYACHVSRIERKTSDDGATPGIRVECKLDGTDGPDDGIILGIESKIDVMTAKVASALMIPADAVYGDEECEYVFILEDGKVVKREVVTGTRNEDSAEIVEGIKEGETVAWDESSELTDGQSVKVK